MRVAELKALVKEHGLRGYSRLRKAELIAFRRDNLQPPRTPAPRTRPQGPWALLHGDQLGPHSHLHCKHNQLGLDQIGQDNMVDIYDGQNQFKVPFMMYADFEVILKPVQGPSPDPNKAYTMKVNQHIPSGYCVYSKFAYGDVKEPLTIYRGEDCAGKFCKYIRQEAHRLYHMFPENPMDPLTNRQWKSYKRASKCHICYKLFNSKDPKVRDHCHYTGYYRGPTHTLCNLRYKILSYIPVIFHNLSSYDTHLFIKELGNHSNDIGVIAKNKEDYITFLVNVTVDKYQDKNGDDRDKFIELRFIDSFKFMASSLDSLMNNLVGCAPPGGCSSRKLIGFEDYSELQYNLLTRKGIYLYEYMSSWDKFEESQLPPMEAFCSNLNMSNVSEDDYQHAQIVWKEFRICNLGEYHDLYLRTDVILLANVFDAFRDTCLEHFFPRSSTFLYITWIGLESLFKVHWN